MNPVDLHFQTSIAHWSWTIAAFLWFVGIAGMGSVAYYFVRKKPMAIVIFASLVLGLALVFSHLGRWWNMPMVFWTMISEGHFNFGSWMLIGIAVLSVHLVFSAILLVANLPGVLERFGWLKWTRRLDENDLFVGFFGFIGFFGTVYSGFLISQAVGIPLWNTALIPLLWVISASVATVAVLELFYVFGWVDERVSVFGIRLGLGLDAAKLLAILAFLHVSMAVGAAAGARYGAAEMVSGDLATMTWLGVIGIGILVPMAIAAFTILRGKSKPLLFISSIAALTGVFLLRAVVLLAGVWEPLVL